MNKNEQVSLTEKVCSTAAQLSGQRERKNPGLSSGFPVQTLTWGPTLLQNTVSSHLKFEFGSCSQRKQKSLVKWWWQAPDCLGLNPSLTADELGDLVKGSPPSHL